MSADKGEGLYRRSLYTYWKRTVAPPFMVNFDSPNRETCTVRETRTNTPLQALNLMNDVTFLEASRKLAERMMKEGGSDPAERIASTLPTGAGAAARAGGEQGAARSARPISTRAIVRDAKAARAVAEGRANRRAIQSSIPRELAAYTAVASLILNLDETVKQRSKMKMDPRLNSRSADPPAFFRAERHRHRRRGAGWPAGGSPRLRKAAATGGLPGLPHFAPKAKRVIYLFQSGGPSQMELFDYKPRPEGISGPGSAGVRSARASGSPACRPRNRAFRWCRRSSSSRSTANRARG